MKLKKLIKENQVYKDYYITADEYIPIYKNPSKSEINSIINQSKYNSIRLFPHFDGTIYAWAANVLHTTVASKLSNIRSNFHVGYDINSDELFFYLESKVTSELFKTVLNEGMANLKSMNISEGTTIGGINTAWYGAPRFNIYDEITEKSIQDLLNYDTSESYIIYE